MKEYEIILNPIMIYGTEVMTMTKKDEDKLNITE